MSKDSFDPRFDPAFQPGFEAKAPKAKVPRAARPASPAQAALEAAREHAAEVASAEGGGEDEQESRRPNPFLVALGALSVALITGGVAFGVAIGAGLLFVLAIRWKKND